MSTMVMQLTTEEKEQQVKRNGELIELIKMDPVNKKIYAQEMVTNNIPLVFLMCRKKITSRAYDEDDFQTGCMGLIKAANSFNPDKKVPFASYACFMIERELITAFKIASGWFDREFISNGGAIVSLDAQFDWDQEDQSSRGDMIADDIASLDFIAVLDDFELSRIFNEVINPILDEYCNASTATRTYDVELWRKLETALLLDMIEIEPVPGGITLSKMARMLDLSRTNLGNKHESIMKKIRKELIAKNFIKGEN